MLSSNSVLRRYTALLAAFVDGQLKRVNAPLCEDTHVFVEASLSRSFANLREWLEGPPAPSCQPPTTGEIYSLRLDVIAFARSANETSTGMQQIFDRIQDVCCDLAHLPYPAEEAGLLTYFKAVIALESALSPLFGCLAAERAGASVAAVSTEGASAPTAEPAFSGARPDVPTAAYCLLRGRRVRWEGEPIELSKRLWELLEYLMSHPDCPLKQDAIEETVWDGAEITSKTFANTISRLNSELVAISFPWVWRVSAGEVFRN